jgi:hypothetical protein
MMKLHRPINALKAIPYLATGMFALSASVPAVAQDRTGNRIEDDNKPAAVVVETMAILPWRYRDGTDTAVKTGKEFLQRLMTRAKIDTVSEVKTIAAWEDANGEAWRDDRDKTDLPTPAQMLRVGRRLGVDWVMAGRARWHTRSIWVSLGPKTKSSCTVDALVVDVRHQIVALDAKDVMMDDTAKEDTLKALGAVFISGLFTVVSGGPKTPHEQRAVQLAMAKALQPWLATHIKIEKIDPNAR